MKIKDSNGRESYVPIYLVTSKQPNEDINGVIRVDLKRGKRLDHQGIRVELIGRIEISHERNQTTDFLSMSREIEPTGVISESNSIPFSFNKVEKQYESYSGRYARLRYYVKVTIGRNLASNIVREQEFGVQIPQESPDIDSSIKMEVGIEECLHIEFEYSKHHYHLKDVIMGKVYFLLVRIRIKYMEITIVRRETIGAGTSSVHENETVGKYEVMDGAPVRGENIPIRVYLESFDLGPTLLNVNNKFSVRYFINLVLVDEEDRRYFKQQEISLYRGLTQSRSSFTQKMDRQRSAPTFSRAKPVGSMEGIIGMHNRLSEITGMIIQYVNCSAELIKDERSRQNRQSQIISQQGILDQLVRQKEEWERHIRYILKVSEMLISKDSPERRLEDGDYTKIASLIAQTQVKALDAFPEQRSGDYKEIHGRLMQIFSGLSLDIWNECFKQKPSDVSNQNQLREMIRENRSLRHELSSMQQRSHSSSNLHSRQSKFNDSVQNLETLKRELNTANSLLLEKDHLIRNLKSEMTSPQSHSQTQFSPRVDTNTDRLKKQIRELREERDKLKKDLRHDQYNRNMIKRMKEDHEYELGKLRKQLDIARKRQLEDRGRKIEPGQGRRSGSAQAGAQINFELLYNREKQKNDILVGKIQKKELYSDELLQKLKRLSEEKVAVEARLYEAVDKLRDLKGKYQEVSLNYKLMEQRQSSASSFENSPSKSFEIQKLQDQVQEYQEKCRNLERLLSVRNDSKGFQSTYQIDRGGVGYRSLQNWKEGSEERAGKLESMLIRKQHEIDELAAQFESEKEAVTMLINKVSERLIFAYKNAENRLNNVEEKLGRVQNAENRYRYERQAASSTNDIYQKAQQQNEVLKRQMERDVQKYEAKIHEMREFYEDEMQKLIAKNSMLESNAGAQGISNQNNVQEVKKLKYAIKKLADELQLSEEKNKALQAQAAQFNEEDINKLKQENTHLSEYIKFLNKSMGEMKKQAKGFDDYVLEKDQEIASLKGIIGQLREQLQDSETFQEAYKKESEGLRKSVKALQEKCAVLQRGIDELQQENWKLTEDLSEKPDYDVEGLQEQIQALKKLNAQIKQDNAQMQNDNLRLQQQCNLILKQKEELEVGYQQKLEYLGQKVVNLEIQNEKLQNEIQSSQYSESPQTFIKHKKPVAVANEYEDLILNLDISGQTQSFEADEEAFDPQSDLIMKDLEEIQQSPQESQKGHKEVSRSQAQEYIYQIEDLNGQIGQLQDQLYVYEEQNDILKNQCHKLEQENTNLKNDLAKSEENWQKEQTQLYNQIKEIQTQQENLPKIEELNELQKRIEQLSKGNQEKQAALSQLNEQFQQELGQNNTLRIKLQEQSDNLAKIQEQESEIQRLRNNIQYQVQEIVKLEAHNENLAEENDNLKTFKEQLATQNDTLYNTNQELKDQNSKLSHEIQQLQRAALNENDQTKQQYQQIQEEND